MSSALIAVVLAVGGGRRQFPISTPRFPKFLAPGRSGFSLLWEAVGRVRLLGGACVVATRNAWQAAVSQEVGNLAQVCCIRHVFGSLFNLPWLGSQLGAADNDIVLFVPSDQHVPDPQEFVRCVKEAAASAPLAKLTYVLTPESSEPNPLFGHMAIDVPATGLAHPVRQFIEKPDNSQCQLIAAGSGWYVSTGMIMAHAKTWRNLAEALKKQAQFDGADGQAALQSGDFDTNYAQHHSEVLSAYVANFEWHDVGSPEAYRQLIAGSDLPGPAVLTGDKRGEPFVLSLDPERLVVVDKSLASQVAVIVANGVICVVARDNLGHMDQMLTEVESSPQAHFLYGDGGKPCH